MAIITVTEQNYEELVLRAERPVLVDFWAPWWGFSCFPASVTSKHWLNEARFRTGCR